MGSMKRSIWTILALPLLTIPAYAAEKPVYHDCRPSEDISNGRTVHKTICQNQNGDWVELHPEKKTAPQPPAPALAAANAKPVKKKPVYHDCRPAQDIVNGRPVWKAVCQNEAGAWVQKPGDY
jgi:hypothetical protein